jgi:hypothetical protein
MFLRNLAYQISHQSLSYEAYQSTLMICILCTNMLYKNLLLSIPYVTIPLILCVSQKFLDHFFLFVCRTHAAQRIVDSVPCNLKRVVFESSQERSLRVSISTNSIHVRESPINFNS